MTADHSQDDEEEDDVGCDDDDAVGDAGVGAVEAADPVDDMSSLVNVFDAVL